MNGLKNHIPLLEVLIGLYFYYAAVLIFLVPDVFSSLDPRLSAEMLRFTSPAGWGYAYLFAAVILTIGLMFNFIIVRLFGLGIAAFLFAAIAFCYGSYFPNFSVGLFVFLSMVALSAMLLVKESEL